MTIYRYRLPIQDEVTLLMPCFAQILSVQRQDDNLCMWAIVDPAERPETRRFEIHGTGNHGRHFHNRKFLATVRDTWGVWHVFEVA